VTPREHPAIDDEAAVVQQVHEVYRLAILDRRAWG
jgi:hypothetical protein